MDKLILLLRFNLPGAERLSTTPFTVGTQNQRSKNPIVFGWKSTN
jgi:hypothetical protein